MTQLQAYIHQLIDQLPEARLDEVRKFLETMTSQQSREEYAMHAATEKRERLAAFERLQELCHQTPPLQISALEWERELQNARLGKYACFLEHQ